MSNTDSKIDINPSLASENTMYCKQVKILELHSSFNNLHYVQHVLKLEKNTECVKLFIWN